MDGDGDASIDFTDKNGRTFNQWVFQQNFHLLRKDAAATKAAEAKAQADEIAAANAKKEGRCSETDGRHQTS